MVSFVLGLEGNTGFQRGKDVLREEEVLAPAGRKEALRDPVRASRLAWTVR